MLCVPNQSKTELYKGSSRYLVNVNDIPSGKESNNSGAKKIISIDEFKQQAIEYDFAITVMPDKDKHSSSSFYISGLFIDTPGKPPQINC